VQESTGNKRVNNSAQTKELTTCHLDSQVNINAKTKDQQPVSAQLKHRQTMSYNIVRVVVIFAVPFFLQNHMATEGELQCMGYHSSGKRYTGVTVGSEEAPHSSHTSSSQLQICR
jgi:hypothetical protein